MKLNLGCGAKKIEGFIGVDIIVTPATDIEHNLNIFPYPFDENSVDEVVVDNTLEHLDDVIKVMEEIHRICINGAKVKVFVPYFKSNSAFTDPTHKHFFTETSFKYFEADNALHFYTKVEFSVDRVELISHKEYMDLKHRVRNLIPFRKYLNFFLSNMYDEVSFELICVKD